MPPRYAYWTIIVDNQPTAFRSGAVEELMPTFNRLKSKHPTAILKWFQNGKLWDSRLDAREGMRHQRDEKRRKTTLAWEPRKTGRADRPKLEWKPREERDSKWRPGGPHRDPRQKYKDAKKAKWTRFKQAIRSRRRPPRKP